MNALKTVSQCRRENAVTALIRWSAAVSLALTRGDEIRAIRYMPSLRLAVRHCLELAGIPNPTAEQVDQLIPPLARM